MTKVVTRTILSLVATGIAVVTWRREPARVSSLAAGSNIVPASGAKVTTAPAIASPAIARAEPDEFAENDRQRQLEVFATRVPCEDIPAVLAALRPGDWQSAGGLALLRRWIERDAPAAAAWALRCPDADPRSGLVQAASVFWAQWDLPAAVAWGRAILPDEERTGILHAIATEAVRSEPATAARLARELSEGDARRDALMAEAVTRWAATKPREASAWLEEIPPGHAREKAAAGVVQAWARLEPRAAAAWLGQLDDIALREKAIAPLVREWAEQYPDECARWLCSLQDERAYAIARTEFADKVAAMGPVGFLPSSISH
jgi:hypothetical protein